MPALPKLEHVTTAPGSDLRQLEIQYNASLVDEQSGAFAGSIDAVWSWQTAAANSGQAIGRGSTDTAVATGKLTAAFGGIPESKAAVTTGLAPTAQTVPADQWAIYAIDMVTGGTLSVAPGAANATTGYATEALAIAALPSRITAKARLGYYTVKTKAATAWIGATDALAGGATGNPASVTNYYPFDGLFAPTGTPPTALTSSTGIAWTGGRNGVLIATVLSRGSTDTNLQTTAFTYSANGVTNIAAAAVAAGTAFGALGTIPANQWGVIVAYIDSLGTITFQSGPANYTNGYGSEAVALGDLSKIFPVAGKCQLGYCTIKTKAATAFVVGTDALAGGASGNVAAATNYYPTPGITLSPGMTAAPIAGTRGTVLGAVNY